MKKGSSDAAHYVVNDEARIRADRKKEAMDE